MSSAPFAIAIVGRACVLPGALSPEQLWDVVADGRDMLSTVDEGRWRVGKADILCAPGDDDADRTWTDRGGYVRGFEGIWDPQGFAVSAAELDGLDPLFHWVLHCAREALADAGDSRRGQIARPRVGAVFGNLGFPSAGMSRHAESVWFRALPNAPVGDPRNRFMGGGAAALLERALGLAPGVFCLDTACASSLYAIKIACDQLRDGRVDLALAGAVNRADDLFLHVGFCALDAMSQSGRSRPFHADADGLVPAEGAGFVALKRLADARRDGDRIHGIIRGIGLSNDGRGRGFLAPSEEGQQRAIRQAYELGAVDPAAVSWLECHATGTVVGDTTELRSSASVFTASRDLAIGSLKSNLGHSITVAGVAGLIKVLEAMRHGQRPPSLHAEPMNRALADSPFRVVRALEAWPDENKLAGVSAFGFGGNNAHLIVGQDDRSISSESPAGRSRQALAIVGIGTVVGSAIGVQAFESALLSGASLIDPTQRAASTGALDLPLTGVRFPPNDLRRTLPQQLLVLAAAREAMDGQPERSRETTGVFLGMEVDPDVCRYGARWRVPALLEAGLDLEHRRAWIDETREGIVPVLVPAGVVGTMPNIPANRLNAQFDIGGPSWTVFAGEASGTCALALAAHGLWRGELDTALVCGVDLSCNDIHVAALAGVEGERTTPGDAAVVLVVRRLSDARAAGERILGVLDPSGELSSRSGSRPESSSRSGSRPESGPSDPTLAELDNDERLGRCWAAGELRDLAAALISGRRGARPDARAWPEPRSLRVDGFAGTPAFQLRPRSAVSELVSFGGTDVDDLERALATGRIGGTGTARAVIVAGGPAELDTRIARVRRHLSSGSPPGPGVAVRRTPIGGELAWVFTGAGAAYRGMGATVLDALPMLRRTLAERSPELTASFDAPWADDAAVAPLQRLWASSFLCQAHAILSRDLLGLRPQAVIGYSSGESNALFATGIWTDHDAMIAACRDSGVFTREIGGEFQAVARAWGEANPRWETWTVLARISEIEAALAGETRAHLSVIHHDGEGIVVGDPLACARVREKLGQARWLRLDYDLAVHVPELMSISDVWLDVHRRRVTPRSDVRVYSAGLAAAYEPSTEACAQAILGQADHRLDFRRVIERAYADGVRVFVEHGPQAGCSRWIREILGDRDAVVVALDRKGGGVDALLDGVAQLMAAGVACTPEVLVDALKRGSGQAAKVIAGPRLTVEVHPPVRVRPPESTRGTSGDRGVVMQAMPPAPRLPSVDAVAPALSFATATLGPSIPGPVFAPLAVDDSGPSGDPIAAAFRAQIAELGRRQREFIEQQSALHQQFLGLRERSLAMLVQAGSGPSPGPMPMLMPAPMPTLAPMPAPMPMPAPVPMPAPIPMPTAAGGPMSTPEREIAVGPRKPIGPTFDRAALEVHASGRISEIFGAAFADQDSFTRQVRMPEPPLLLADRVTGLDAEPMSLKLGTVWTETDVTSDAWYLHAGRMPAGIMIESGQADLVLISYLGVDSENRSDRVYRLLGCTLTYHGGLPRIGETLCYDIHLDGHAKQGGTRLMFFHYDCHIDGQLRLSVRKGQAGFFTDAELAASEGCLWRPEDQAIVPEPRLDPPAHRCVHSTFSPERVAAFAAGRPWECFGDPTRDGFEPWDLPRSHTRTPRISGGRMLFLDRVDRFEVRGGPWERGYLSATTTVTPEHWFFAGHFHNDPCMPGTLMFEGCLQAMAFFLTGLGFTVNRDGWRFEPVEGEPFPLSCRGQVTPRSQNLRYEVFVEEVIAGPIPTVYADLLCTVDGLKAFHARRVGLRLVPGWPLDEGNVLLDGYVEPGPVARTGAHAFDYRAMLACANGRPSEAFGPIYARFDGTEPVARLPNPPYHFITRALHIDGEIGALRTGMAVELEYDIPPDEWYFAENGNRTMPYAVLLEAALQPCGWLASYMGCALASTESLMFRNLDGTGTLHFELPPDAGSLRTKVVNTKLSKTPTMIIVGFDVECRLGDRLVYSMDTVFGFFPASAFDNQAGLPTTPEQRALFDAPATGRWELDGSIAAVGRPRMARPKLLMLDRVTGFEPSAGAAGLGRARAEKDVDPGEWFFKAHFFQDPVQPGSLGIEAMIQLLQWTMLELEMDAGMAAPRFEPLALGDAMTWKYRGQVTPRNRVITTTLEITERGRDDRGAFARANASLWVDGKRIYEASNVGMRIVDGGAGDGRRVVLDPETDSWLSDHCPTWTVPALPMMSMVDLLAQAARSDERVIGLRDIRVKGWLVCDGPTALRCERDADTKVSLFLDAGGPDLKSREVASARLVVGSYAIAPDAFPALDGPACELPYDDGSLFHGPAFQLLDSLVRTRVGASSVVRAESTIPIGRLNPALLDAGTHGIPHDRLSEWDDRFSPDKVAYPAWIPELDIFGPTPTQGTIRCEVRPAGFVASADFPAFEIQWIGPRGVWARARLVEACFPKGKLGSADPRQRRAFLRDHLAVPGLGLAETTPTLTTLAVADVAASDWLPGTVAGIYGSADPITIATKDHVAAAQGVHPFHVPGALPLTRFELDTQQSGSEVHVRGDAKGRLDITPIREFWTRWFDRGAWPVEVLYYGLIDRFVRRVVLTDPAGFAAVRGRSLLFLGNHQVGVESLLFSVLASGLSGVPTVTLAKAEHRTTWLGRLIAHCFSYPGIRDPRLITFFDREDKDSLMTIIGELATEMRGPGRSVMVHVEGTRSLSCATRVEKMSGAFLDLAMAVGAPVVPIRFTGGLPVDPLQTRLEFPLGMGKQDIWIGSPIDPRELGKVPYGERKRRVIDAINGLGPASVDERPIAGDPRFATKVERWQAERQVGPEHAVLRSMLAELAHPGAGISRLLAASRAEELADGTAEGEWLVELGRRLIGS